MNCLDWINLGSVGVFGMILSAAFCDIVWTRGKRLAMAVSMAVLLMFQGIIYFCIDPDIVEVIYPLITHLPLAVVLCVLSRRWLWPTISVLTAYLCCQMRRWLALLTVTVFSGGSVMQDAAELVITLPLLLVLLWLVAPSVRAVSRFTVLVQWQFGLVPALYYAFDYLTRVYTDLLMEGGPVVVEFMPFVCSVAYLVFVFRTSEAERIRSRLEQIQDSMNQQITQAVREIGALRKSEQKTRTYRHDLRHHMQYLSQCIENGRLEQAQEYIQKICSDIESNKVVTFCENEAANLIFSSFAGRIRERGIALRIRAKIPQDIPVSENDLCVLLSNALENALHACEKRIKRGLSGGIDVLAYEKKGRFFLQLTNSCDADIVFEHGIPVTDHPGHGIGVRSICAIAEQYGGIYSFLVEEERFILRVSI